MSHSPSTELRALLLISALLVAPSLYAEIPSRQTLNKALQAAEKRWKKADIHSYSYIAARTCKMCDRPVRVEVRNNSCIRVATISEPVKEVSCDGYTMQDVFGRLRTLINDDISTTSLLITFDEKLGYPSRFQLQTIVPHEKEQDDIVEFKALK